MEDALADLTSGDDVRAERAVSLVADFGEEIIPSLLELAHADSIDSRWWAVRALAASPHTRTEDLLPLLKDSASEVRAAAALALCQKPDEKAVPDLIHLLADEDSLTAGLAGNALVKIGGPAVSDLLKVMNEAPLPVKILAIRALAEIRDHRAIPILMKSMSEESTVLQYWAQQGLERLGLDMVYIKP